MDKNQILQAVSQALDSMGVTSSDPDFYGESEAVQENNVPIWSQLQVGVNDEGRGPIHDKAALFQQAKQMSKPPMVGNFNEYGMPQDDEGAEMMTAMGMV